MSTGPVEEILFRQFMIWLLVTSCLTDLSVYPGSAIAAVNSGDHLRVYTQDVQGNIRESSYEGKWSNGTIKNVIAKGKIGSPIAACSKALNEVGVPVRVRYFCLENLNHAQVRVYYVSVDNKLREHCYSANKGWYAGDLNSSNVAVAPYSKVAACFLAVGSDLELRVYCQSHDNSIQEYGSVRYTTDPNLTSINIPLRMARLDGKR